MSFRPEPSHRHGTIDQTAVVLVNLGTPDAPTASSVRRYLKQFLSDPRVVEISRLLWWFVLNWIIVPFRSGKSAKKYAMIWSRDGSPLRVNTQAQAQQLRGHLAQRGHQQLQVAFAMRYGQPSLPSVLDRLKQEGCDRILVLPAYPQYSGATTGSIYDAVFEHYKHVRNVPELRLVKHYHDHDGYLDALAASVETHWEANGRPDQLVMSFHGMPKRTLLLGDPYHCECHKTARLLAAKLHLSPEQYVLTFQSRFGKAEWLQPYTSATLNALALGGTKRVDVICPGFTSDCLETLEEIAIEGKQIFLSQGGEQFNYIACLNSDPAWIAALAEIAEQHMIGWPTMLPVSEREGQKRAAEAARAVALRLGAVD
jgi:ferrochelatase